MLSSFCLTQNYSPETENMMLLLVFEAVSKQTNVTKLLMMKEHVTQCSGVTHWHVFNSFWTTEWSFHEESKHIMVYVVCLSAPVNKKNMWSPFHSVFNTRRVVCSTFQAIWKPPRLVPDGGHQIRPIKLILSSPETAQRTSWSQNSGHSSKWIHFPSSVPLNRTSGREKDPVETSLREVTGLQVYRRPGPRIPDDSVSTNTLKAHAINISCLRWWRWWWMHFKVTLHV